MRIFAIAIAIAAAAAVASAALPVEPMNAFVLQQEDNEQHVLQDKKPFDMSPFKLHFSLSICLHSPNKKKKGHI